VLFARFFTWLDSSIGPRPPRCWGFEITLRHITILGLLWTSDRPVAWTSTWNDTTLSRDRNLCLRQDSNPQCQQANGHRSTPYTACPVGFLWVTILLLLALINSIQFNSIHKATCRLFYFEFYYNLLIINWSMNSHKITEEVFFIHEHAYAFRN
jgi:hypothetical protein